MTVPAQTYALDASWLTLLKDLGVSPAHVLRRAGLADDLLHQPALRLAPAEYYRFWDGLDAEAGDPTFALRLCQAIRTESFLPPLFAALCSPDLRIAAQRVATYKALVAPMRLDVTGARDLTLELTWLDAPLVPPVSLVMFELLLSVALVRIATREHVRPLAVSTTVLPSPIAPYEAFAGVRIQRAAHHRVVFAAVDAGRPFLTSNAPMWNVFEPALRQRLADLDATVTTTQRVRAALLEALPSGLATMDDIARKLALSKRTLQRRLEAEATSFQQVLKDTREALARHYLARTALPVAEISFLLGFDEPNSFYRAFRSWTGTTPESLRAGA